MKDFRAIFEAVESTLIREGSRNLPEAELRSRLDKFKEVEGRRFTDNEVYRHLVDIAFYSGFRAATVNEKGFGPRRSRIGRKARNGGVWIAEGSAAIRGEPSSVNESLSCALRCFAYVVVQGLSFR